MNEKIYFPLLDNKGENSEISPHFGHAPYFGLYDTGSRNLKITNNNLEHHDEQRSPVDQIMETASPTMVYTQGIGGRAIGLFREKGVAVKTGVYLTVKDVVANLDKLSDAANACQH
ncbi:MAG: NifB/NifX family molybdenum-iron cluster-binding protein [Candidatus Falkowbacteria bacterium]